MYLSPSFDIIKAAGPFPKRFNDGSPFLQKSFGQFLALATSFRMFDGSCKAAITASSASLADSIQLSSGLMGASSSKHSKSASFLRFKGGDVKWGFATVLK